uniref:Chitin-binding type-2 domain-containing protein n=1 Tax=Scylla olivacea TaxID=85551 RepID=A0A0P4WTM1_SCYOL
MLEMNVYFTGENGKAVKHYCSSGLLFNRDTSQCDLAINVDCSEGAWEVGSFTETVCVDHRSDCDVFVKEGGCTCQGDVCDWQTFVLHNCPKSCGNSKGSLPIRLSPSMTIQATQKKRML